MTQSLLLIQALKQELKNQNKTYADVAKHLHLSEASIKRIFAQEQMTLARVDAICDLLGIEMTDLLQKMQQSGKRLHQLTLEQENLIISDRKLCLITICLINRWSVKEILNHYKISEHECIKALATLDKIKLIELLPNNRVKLLISSRFNWIPNGPIQQFFQKFILHDFTNSKFQNKNEELICQFGMLTDESLILFKKKLQALALEFNLLSEQDIKEPLNKRAGSACVLMIRPWVPVIFTEFTK